LPRSGEQAMAINFVKCAESILATKVLEPDSLSALRAAAQNGLSLENMSILFTLDHTCEDQTAGAWPEFFQGGVWQHYR